MGNYTVYVNPYLVLRSGGYTKHFYIEGQRIVSKLGGGWKNAGSTAPAGGTQVDYSGKGKRLLDGIVKNLKFLGADGSVLTAGKSGKVPPGQVNGGGNVTEAFRYFYHPDHLGSTSYVTDASGEVYQHLEYFAFGETFVEEHSNTNRIPYLFNGKELDEETGLYYYGARYYDARTSVWVSVDPKMDKYPGWSSYNYTLNNPQNYSDPDGKDPIFNRRGRLIGDDGNNEGAIHVVYNRSQAKQIAKATLSGTKVTSLSGIDKVTLQGGEETVKGVIASVKAASSDGLHEEGGHTQKSVIGEAELKTGQQESATTVARAPGMKRSGADNASIAPFNGVEKPNNAELLDYWHVHTSGTANYKDASGEDRTTSSASGPSGGDMKYDKQLKGQGYNATAIQVDTRGTDRVNFYNGKVKITSMELKYFQKITE
jgi:RHS repeat-associated protein